MLFGPPIRLLLQAHRTGQRLGLGVHSEQFWVSIILEKRRVVYAAGVPDLLGGLTAPRVDPEQLNGVMAHDMELAIRAGHPAPEVIDAACRGMGRFLAGLIDAEGVTAHLDPDPYADPQALPMPKSAVALLSEGMQELRPPGFVAQRFHDDRHHLVVAKVLDDTTLIDLDPITLRTLRLVRRPVPLGDLAVRSGRNQPLRTEHFWRSFDLLYALGLLELMRPDVKERSRFVSSDTGGWEQGVRRPPPRTPASAPRRRPTYDSREERLGAPVGRPVASFDAPARAEPAPPPPLGRPVARLEPPPRDSAPPAPPSLFDDLDQHAPDTTFVFEDLGALDGGNDGVLEAFADDEELSVEEPAAALLMEEPLAEEAPPLEEEAPADAWSFEAPPEEEPEGLLVEIEDEDPATSMEFVFDAEDPATSMEFAFEVDDAGFEADEADTEEREPPEEEDGLDALLQGFEVSADEDDPLDLLGGGAEPPGPQTLSLDDLASPEQLQSAIDARQRGDGGLMALLDEEDEPTVGYDEPEIIVEDEDEDDSWTGSLPIIDDEDVDDPISEIHEAADAVLDSVAPRRGGALSPVSADELLEMSALCGELNPLAILQLNLDQLDGMLTLDGVREAFQRERRRYDPLHFTDASADVRDAVQALDEILRASREALRDAAIVAMWVRALRAFAEERDPPSAQSLVEARRHFERAQALAFKRDWRGASLAVTEALQRWPGQPRVRLLQVFCEVAQRRISPMDGVFNIDSMFLTEPAEQALAQVTAGRLLKACGRSAQAVARFRAALELDPGRADARRELDAAQQ